MLEKFLIQKTLMCLLAHNITLPVVCITVFVVQNILRLFFMTLKLFHFLHDLATGAMKKKILALCSLKTNTFITSHFCPPIESTNVLPVFPPFYRGNKTVIYFRGFFLKIDLPLLMIRNSQSKYCYIHNYYYLKLGYAHFSAEREMLCEALYLCCG